MHAHQHLATGGQHSIRCSKGCATLLLSLFQSAGVSLFAALSPAMAKSAFRSQPMRRTVGAFSQQIGVESTEQVQLLLHCYAGLLVLARQSVTCNAMLLAAVSAGRKPAHPDLPQLASSILCIRLGWYKTAGGACAPACVLSNPGWPVSDGLHTHTKKVSE